MTVRVKKPITKDKLKKAEKLLLKKLSTRKKFNAKKFAGKLKGVFDPPKKASTKSAVKMQEIRKGLGEVPVERLNEVEELINSILSEYKTKKEPKTLKGIWANKGFERIADLQSEIKKTRKNLGDQILKKYKG